MELIIVTIAVIGLAFWLRSSFINLIAGMVAIGFGIYWIAANGANAQYWFYIMEGIAIIGVGMYLLLTEAVNYLKGR